MTPTTQKPGNPDYTWKKRVDATLAAHAAKLADHDELHDISIERQDILEAVVTEQGTTIDKHGALIASLSEDVAVVSKATRALALVMARSRKRELTLARMAQRKPRAPRRTPRR